MQQPITRTRTDTTSKEMAKLFISLSKVTQPMVIHCAEMPPVCSLFETDAAAASSTV